MPDSIAERHSWYERIRQELAPRRGRMAGALRTTLALVITILLLQILRVPAMAYGVFMIFLVSYETPYLSFQRGLIALCTQFSGAVAALCLISITGNNPVARVLGVALFAFIAAFIRASSVRFILQPIDFAVYAIGTLECFDSRLSDMQAVSLSLWPVAAGSVAVGTKIAVEYIFTRRNPYHDLYREIQARLSALEQIFQLFGSGTGEEAMQPQVAQVRCFAFMGQGKMHSLLQEIEERHKRDFAYEVEPSSIPLLARLLDLAAAFAVHHSPDQLSDQEKERLKRLARVVAALQESKWSVAEENLQVSIPSHAGELDRMEHSLSRLVANYSGDIPRSAFAQSGEGPLTVARKRWLAVDCWTNPEYTIFSFKVALCAMICFVIYDALAWPGISTAVITVMVATLSSSGATNQKLLFRFLGSTLGGVVFGLGCIVFVYPYSDSIVPFLLTAAVVTFIAAWVIRSPHYSYIGLQIAFSYYLVVFTGFSAPIQMAPARDRLIGILLALLVMMVIFRPEKSVDKMRETFAHLLSTQAEYLKATALHLPASGRRLKAMELKSQMENIVSTGHGFTELIAYEFTQHREEHMQAAERIEQAMLSSGDLLLSVGSWPLETSSEATDESIRLWRKTLETGIRAEAAALDQNAKYSYGTKKDEVVLAELHTQLPGTLPAYIRNSAEIYQELHQQCCKIASE